MSVVTLYPVTILKLYKFYIWKFPRSEY